MIKTKIDGEYFLIIEDQTEDDADRITLSHGVMFLAGEPVGTYDLEEYSAVIDWGGSRIDVRLNDLAGTFWSEADNEDSQRMPVVLLAA